MNIRNSALTLFVLFIMCGEILPQKRPPGALLKKTPVTKTAAQKRIPDYQINLKIADGGRYFVSIVSTDQSGRLDVAALSSLIADLPTGADTFNKANDVFPNVVVDVGPNVPMLGFWNPITLFRQGRTNISVAVPTGLSVGDDIIIQVPWDLAEPDRDVKPSPLWLVVSVAEDGKLSLNNEPVGTLSNTEILTKNLQQIFKDREVNGVFREGTNDLEKSVTIVMPMSSRKFSDFVTVARAVWLSGGDQISLAMKGPFDDFLNDQNGLSDLPQIEPKGLLNEPPVPPKKKP